MIICKRHFLCLAMPAIVWPLLPLVAIAQSPVITDHDIDELIEHLVAILKSRQESTAEIQVFGPIRISSTGETMKVKKVYQGTVISKGNDRIIFKTLDGTRFEVAPSAVLRLDGAGHFRGEKTALHSHGGRTALATLALTSAGLGRHDLTVSKALQYLEHHPMPGTYGRALRASLYSLLIQQSTDDKERKGIFRLLRRDARWLILAMNELGGYTYTFDNEENNRSRNSKRYDNSNSQFGTLGVWSSALAGYDAPRGYWPRIDQFWTWQQNEDGGWGYRARQKSTQNMTIAGINSLIIVLDQLHSKTSGRYRLFKGIKKSPQTQNEITRVRRSIAAGMDWLGRHGKPYDQAYTQLGHERLGLASGEKYFGSYDWYRAGAEGAMRIGRWERKSIENVSMWLLFLAYGRAPVLVNKLRWGDQAGGWDYYYRDMYHACRFLSNTYEQLYKWQIVDTTATLSDLQDAPILYIAGDGKISWPDSAATTFKEYVNGGGIIVGHANFSSKAFASSFKRTFEKMFAEWGGEFRKLSYDHPIYQSFPGAKSTARKIKVPIWALSDGFRESVILLPSDIAGAWHQSLDDDFPDLFRLFASIRFYTAGRYNDLPGRLRPDRLAGPDASPWGTLRVARARSGADKGGARTVWREMDKLMTKHYGVSLIIDRDVLLANINEASGYDIVHIAGQGKYTFTAAEVRAIQNYCRKGGLLLVEALGGDIAFAQAALDQLQTLFGESLQSLDASHALIQGDFPRGKPLHNLKYTPAARKTDARPSQPPFRIAGKDDVVHLLFSPLDISASANGHFTSDLRGYAGKSGQKILRNIILYRLAQKNAAN